MKKHMEILVEEKIAIDAIPLATKPPMIVEYKLIREGIMGHYQLIRADGSFKRYSSMIRMLQGIDREDLQTLWKLVKTKHGDTRPEDEHERVLWGDLKVMFEPDIRSDVWRNLQGYKVTIWVISPVLMGHGCLAAASRQKSPKLILGPGSSSGIVHGGPLRGDKKNGGSGGVGASFLLGISPQDAQAPGMYLVHEHPLHGIRHKGKEISKPITPPFESASEEDNNLEQAQRDKEMQKNLVLIVNYFKKLYKPTNNNLKTSSNSKNKKVDTTPIYMNENQTGQFGNQRTVIVAGARETVDSQEKMLMCKQAEKGVQLQVEQVDWLEDTDEEVDEQELEVHYSFMAKIQEVLPADSGSDAELLEKVGSNVIPNSLNMCDNDNQADQNAKECDDKHVSAHEECKSNLDESNKPQDSYLVALHDKEVELVKYTIFKDHTIENDTLERKLKETLGLLAQKEHDIKEGLKIKAFEISVVIEKNDELVKQSLLTKSSCEGLLKEKNKVINDLKVKEGQLLEKLIAVKKQLNFLNEIVYKRNQPIQTIYILAPKCSTYNGRPTFASEKPCLYETSYDKDDLANIFAPDRDEILTLEQESRSKLNKDIVKPYDYTKQNSLYENFKQPS
ncbi:hypothetical protein Tco_1448978 [Tanacetum coccineum]